MFNIFDVAASGMEAQKVRLDIIASNLANVNTVRGEGGVPYRRRDVVFGAIPRDGFLVPVRVMGIVQDQRPFKRVYHPGHPEADEEGYILLPNIDPVEEMVNMISAIRAYEANVAVFNSAKDMAMRALEIGR